MTYFLSMTLLKLSELSVIACVFFTNTEAIHAERQKDSLNTSSLKKRGRSLNKVAEVVEMSYFCIIII